MALLLSKFNFSINICRLWSTKLIFVGDGQLNATTVLDILQHACMTLAV